VAHAIADLITVSGFLYALFYANHRPGRFLVLPAAVGKVGEGRPHSRTAPLSGAALLLWVAWKGEEGLTSSERFILIGIGALGLILMGVAARVYRAPIFQTKLESASTDEATLRVGTD